LIFWSAARSGRAGMSKILGENLARVMAIDIEQ
jgi:hypothetical protein